MSRNISFPRRFKNCSLFSQWVRLFFVTVSNVWETQRIHTPEGGRGSWGMLNVREPVGVYTIASQLPVTSVKGAKCDRILAESIFLSIANNIICYLIQRYFFVGDESLLIKSLFIPFCRSPSLSRAVWCDTMTTISWQLRTPRLTSRITIHSAFILAPLRCI